MIVYHGSSMIVNVPDVLHSKDRLDFGKGFYVTGNLAQAEHWARRKAIFSNLDAGYVSIYEMEEKSSFAIKDFGENLENWIDFVCACRDGSDIFARYDVIKGKVADDKVFRVVSMYMRGVWDKSRALQEMRIYETYDQIAFVTQPAIDAMLKFKDCTEVPL